MEIQSLQGLVEKAAPKQETFKEKVTRFVTGRERAVPSETSVEKAKDVKGRMEVEVVLHYTTERAGLEKTKNEELTAANTQVEESRKKAREIIARQDALRKSDKSVAKGKDVFFEDTDDQLAEALKAEKKNYNEALTKKIGSQEAIVNLRGELPSKSWEEDADVAGMIVESERTARALEYDLANNLSEVMGLDNKVSSESLDKLRKMAAESRNLAVTAAEEADFQIAAMHRSLTWLGQRDPAHMDSAMAMERNFVTKKRESMLGKESPLNVDVEAVTKAEADRLLAELAQYEVTDKTLVGKAMLQAGFEVDTEKSGEEIVWKLSEERDSTAKLKIRSEARYASLMGDAKAALERVNDKDHSNPDRAVAAYIAINKAANAANNGIVAENTMRNYVIEVAKEQKKISAEALKNTKPELKKVIDKIEESKKKGLSERFAGWKKDAWGRLRELATEKETKSRKVEELAAEKRNKKGSEAEKTRAELDLKIAELKRQVAAIEAQLAQK